MTFRVSSLSETAQHTAVMHVLLCGWCGFDRFIFCSGYFLGSCVGLQPCCEQVWINTPGQKMLPWWAVNRLDLLLRFSLSSSLLFACHTRLFLQLHPAVLPSSISSSLRLQLLHTPFSLQFPFNHLPPSASALCHCLPRCFYSLPSTENEASQRGNMINRLHFCGIPGVTFPSLSEQHGNAAF